MQLITKGAALKGTIAVPGDKSISHRAVMLGAIATGTTIIKGFLRADDCLGTISIFRQLGVPIDDDGDILKITGQGMNGLSQPKDALDVGNSGTTMRLIAGLLSGQDINVTISGDASIKKRPMNRVMLPLKDMGVLISGYEETQFPPITIKKGSVISPITYKMPVASAQVKSAILLAGLYATGQTKIIEDIKSRDHSEVMLRQFGADVLVEDNTVSITGPTKLTGVEIVIPGDISSAAFLIVAALLVPGSDITITNVGLSATRTGIIDVIQSMGGNIKIDDFDSITQSGTIRVKYSKLQGTTISGDIIPRLIDEIPIIALLATQATGETIISDAQELRVKETDRIDAVVKELSAMGADIVGKPDGLIIKGSSKLKGAEVDSHHDHRIGMMLQIASLLVDEPVILKNSAAISVSYPSFFDDLNFLIGE